MSIVIRPNVSGRNGIETAATKSSIIETPVTISGFIIGIFVTPRIAPESQRLRILFMPNAANVPISVARSDETTAR